MKIDHNGMEYYIHEIESKIIIGNVLSANEIKYL